jgi:hypothetical protein
MGLSSLLTGFGLSTAAGLNAYLPLLVVGLLGRYTNLIHLSEPYSLLSNPVVLLAIAVLALLDFVGDKIPAVDHVLHVGGLFVAPIAGAILFMAMNGQAGTVSPVLAAICGVILAGSAHGVRATARPIATATTGGVANPVLSFLEDVTSLVLSVVAIVLPVLAFLLIVLFAFLIVLLFRRLRRRRAPDIARPDGIPR